MRTNIATLRARKEEQNPTIGHINFIEHADLILCSPYSDYVTDLEFEEPWFDSRKEQEYYYSLVRHCFVFILLFIECREKFSRNKTAGTFS
jgi:hypothetical protein